MNPRPVQPGRALTRRPLLGILVLAALPYLVAAPFDFVYDDHGQILENPFLQHPGHLIDVVTLQTLDRAEVVNGRRPVVLATYFIDKALYGRQAWGWHVTNLLLHLVTVALIFGLVKRCADRRSALAAALVFGFHPLLFEAVHLPAFRPDLLYMMFTLAALLIATDLVERYSWRWLWRVMAFALCAMLALCSKEAGILVAPLVALTWWCRPRLRPRAGTMQVLGGCALAVAVVFVLLGLGGAPLQAAGVSWNGVSYPWPENLWTAPWLFARYLGLMVWPYPLVVDRIVPAVQTLADPRWWAGVVVILAAAAGVLRWKNVWPLAALGTAWMFTCFAPVSNAVPLLNPFAERYAYGMTAGFAMLLASRWNRLSPAIRRNTAVLLVGGYAVAHAVNLPAWRDDAALWSATLERQPASTRAMVWSALEQKKAGDITGAVSLLEQALRTNPRDASALINLAVIHGQAGRLKQAETLLRDAIRLRPEYSAAYENLALDLELQGRPAEAREVLKQGLRVNPLNLAIRHRLMRQLMAEGDKARAAELARETLELVPGDEAAAGLLEEAERP